MAISTQKVILLILMLNIALGTVIQIFNNPYEVPSSNEITKLREIQDEYEEEVKSQQGIYGGLKSASGDLIDRQIGGLKWDISLLGTILKGLNPWLINPESYTHPLEIIWAYLINAFRSILYAVVIITELFLVFRNKKTG